MFNRYEKFAIFNLVIMAGTILIYFILLNAIGFSSAWGAFGFIGFIGLGRYLFLRKKHPSEIVDDERDKAIQMKASSRGYYFSYMFLAVSSLAIYLSYNEGGLVPVDFLIMFPWTGFLVFNLVSSIITLVQYRKGTSCGTC